MRIVILSACFVVFLIGCNRHEDKGGLYTFDEIMNVNTTNLPTDDSVLIKYPYRVAKNDSLLFVLDLHPTDHFVQVFFGKDRKYLGSLCKKGEGPDEFITVDNIQIVNDSLYIYAAKNEIYVYHVNDILKENEKPKIISLTKDFGFLSRGIKLGTNFYFPVFNTTNDNRVLEFDSEGKYIGSFGEIRASDTEELSASSAYHQAWMPFLGGSGNILVAGTQFGDILDIFDGREQLTIRGAYGEPVFKTYKGYAIHEGIQGFQDIIVHNGYIIGLFSGVDVKSDDRSLEGADNLYVWDYKGNPIKHIKLDRRFMTIYPDPDGTLLALDINSDHPLYRIDMPKL